jgi:hypothetical protein
MHDSRTEHFWQTALAAATTWAASSDIGKNNSGSARRQATRDIHPADAKALSTGISGSLNNGRTCVRNSGDATCEDRSLAVTCGGHSAWSGVIGITARLRRIRRRGTRSRGRGSGHTWSAAQAVISVQKFAPGSAGTWA